jgi:hypothetical protein
MRHAQPPRRFSVNSRSVARIALVVACIFVLAVVPTALAGKGGGKGGGGKPSGGGTTATGSFSLVLLDSTDGVAHYGQRITFNATSSATYYFVGVTCSQNGATVYRADKGFYVGWPWSQDYYLQSSAWTGGSASCSAELYSQNSDGSNRQSLGTMSFPVAA